MCPNSSLIIPASIILLAALVLSFTVSCMLKSKPGKRRSFLECSKDWAKRWRGRR